MEKNTESYDVERGFGDYRSNDWVYVAPNKIEAATNDISLKIENISKRFFENLQNLKNVFENLPSSLKPPKSVVFKIDNIMKLVQNLDEKTLNNSFLTEKINIGDISRYIRFHFGDAGFNLLQMDCDFLCFAAEILKQKNSQGAVKGMKIKNYVWQELQK